jgi:hypothetical protein
VSFEVSGEVVAVEYEFDGDYFTVKQVKLNIFGNEFYLDPDQAHNLRLDIDTALFEIGGN